MQEELAVWSRIKIFVGEFGSGKTELAINYALQLKDQGYATALVDIDLAKPNFRARESRVLLEEHGVRVVASEDKYANSGFPNVPHDLTQVLYERDRQVVMDVGGGKSSIVLGQLHKKLKDNSYLAMLVVNTRRPFTNTPEAIVATLGRIEAASRLTIGGLVSNTNLAGETTELHVHEGLAIVEEAAQLLKLPINWVVIPEWIKGIIVVPYPVFTLRPYIHYPGWASKAEDSAGILK